MQIDTWGPLKKVGKWLGGAIFVLLVGTIVYLAFSKPPVPSDVYEQVYVNANGTGVQRHYSYNHVLVNIRITFGKNYMTIQRGTADTGRAGAITNRTPLTVKQVRRDDYLATYVRRQPTMQVNVARSYRRNGKIVLVLQDGTKLYFNKALFQQAGQPIYCWRANVHPIMWISLRE